ncbi:MAG: recombinase family protein [Clostridia bacterium]|nr:recombinase family protein [Clostridia bacterium]
MKAAIYCRLSEEDKNKQFETDDSSSIQNQKAMLLQYAMEHEWEVYNIYSDDDYAGADRKRPEFNRLIKDAENKKFDIVLCKTQSRFTRELELVEKYIHGLFPLWGIRFVSVVDNADTANKGNKKSRQINGLVNEWYLEDMSDNIKSVLTNRRQNGFHIGAFALYGYKKDPDLKGHLIIDEEAAAVVREIFTLFAQGMGKTAIARLLNDRGIPNPTEYKRLHGMRYKQPQSKNGTLWKYFAISDMLKNEMYIGNMVQGKYGSISYKTKQNKPRPKSEWYIAKGTHEPIIDRELWDRVQKMISERAKPFSSGNIGLFAKKVHCAGCGYIMRSHKSHGNHYLQCPNRYVSENACGGAYISADKLENTVITEINRLSAEYLDKDELERSIKFCDNLQGQKNYLISNIEAYNKKIAEYSKSIRDMYMDKVKGLISESDFTEMSRNFSIERDRLKCVVSDEEKKLNDLTEKIKMDKSNHSLAEKYTNLERLDREMIEILIDYIIIYKRIPGTRNVPIEIHWNF